MQNTRKKDIRITAASFRENCRIGRYGIIDLFRECERWGYKLLRYPLGENADLGFVMRRDSDIVIYTNTSIRLSREIFTLAHEIGHAILHMDSAASFVDNDNTISGRDVDEMEQEANYFAACLLMPDDEVTKFLDLEMEDAEDNDLSALDIAKLMSEFNVSFDMAINRLENLGKISTEQRLRLDNERNEMRVGNLLRSVGGNYQLNVSSNIVQIPSEYMQYVIFNYNNNAIPMETLEKTLHYYHLSVDDIKDKLVVHAEENEDELADLIGGLTD